MSDSNLKVEGWAALAEVLGIMRSMQDGTSVPSVELTVDSKAMIKATVKCYAPDPDMAKDDCTRIFDELCTRYGIR